MPNKRTHNDDYEPVIPRYRFLTDPIVPTVNHYKGILRVARNDNIERLVDFCEDVINVYEKHDIDTPAIWTLDRKMVEFCGELLDVYEKHKVGTGTEWEEFLQ